MKQTHLGGYILDPCSGGDDVNSMSYPLAISNVIGRNDVLTVDIREDSLAKIKGDFLKMKFSSQPKVIITNPPFNISREIIEKSLEIVEDGGFVIMLLRLNYFGGKVRRDLWDTHMPKYTFVHNRRMSFTDDGKTDSIEYAHFVWQKGFSPNFTRLKVID